MIVLFVILAFICLWNIKFSKFHEDYISPASSNAIKGIFAIIILFSHMRGYVALGSTLIDTSFTTILYHIGQLMVVMYFFYSGFGIAESIKRKPEYFNSYPKNRLLRTLLHFDLAVLSYIVLMTAIGEKFSVASYILCWIGWESVGNSNWFIFDILSLYTIVYAAYILMRSKKLDSCYLKGIVISVR